MPTFQRGHTTIAYTDTGAPAGREDAPVVFFAHGLLFSGWMFQHQIAALSDRYRCVAIDFRGQGDSPRALGGYDMDTLTSDVTELLRHLQISVGDFVGLSMGGFGGMRLAARDPAICHSLTRMHPVAPARACGARLDSNARAGLVKAIESVADRDPCEAEAGRIIAPTLVVVGDEDAATPPAKSRRLLELISNTTFHEIPGAGHSSSMEQPTRVTSVLEAFLSEHNG